jgi:hypothetical protein
MKSEGMEFLKWVAHCSGTEGSPVGAAGGCSATGSAASLADEVGEAATLSLGPPSASGTLLIRGMIALLGSDVRCESDQILGHRV